MGTLGKGWPIDMGDATQTNEAELFNLKIDKVLLFYHQVRCRLAITSQR